jgi:hypothetical protein
MIYPPHIGAFEFVVLASLRTAQLTRGCSPRVPPEHKHILTAQREVAAGLVTNAAAAVIGEPARLQDDATIAPAAHDAFDSAAAGAEQPVRCTAGSCR